MASFVGTYARALADVVVGRKLDANRVAAELEALVTWLNQSDELRTIWDSPSVSSEQKLKLLDAISKRAGLAREIRNFAAVLNILDAHEHKGADAGGCQEPYHGPFPTLLCAIDRHNHRPTANQ